MEIVNEQRILGVYVARATSKRLPRKVFRDLGGLPLFVWGLKAALASTLDRLIVSTENVEIARTARAYGADVPFLRPEELASDTARNDDVLRHALTWVERVEGGCYDIVVLLQSTAPFMEPEDVDRCTMLLRKRSDMNTVFAARRVHEQPRWMFKQGREGIASTLLQGDLVGQQQLTQSIDPVFIPAGSIWAVRSESIRAGYGVYSGPLGIIDVRDDIAVDVDEEIDLAFADFLRRHFNLEPF